MFETTYQVDLQRSSIGWTGKKVLGQHNGGISFKSGSIKMAGDLLTGGSFVVDMDSITNEDLSDGALKEQLLGHLKSDDFFATDKFPTSVLEITSAEDKGGGKFTVTGNLTIKATTLPTVFEAQFSTEGDTLKASTQLTVDRTKYHIQYGSGSFFSGLGDNMIKDNFTLDIALVLKAGE